MTLYTSKYNNGVLWERLLFMFSQVILDPTKSLIWSRRIQVYKQVIKEHKKKQGEL